MIPLSECSLRNKNAFREGVVELDSGAGSSWVAVAIGRRADFRNHAAHES